MQPATKLDIVEDYPLATFSPGKSWQTNQTELTCTNGNLTVSMSPRDPKTMQVQFTKGEIKVVAQTVI